MRMSSMGARAARGAGCVRERHLRQPAGTIRTAPSHCCREQLTTPQARSGLRSMAVVNGSHCVAMDATSSSDPPDVAVAGSGKAEVARAAGVRWPLGWRKSERSAGDLVFECALALRARAVCCGGVTCRAVVSGISAYMCLRGEVWVGQRALQRLYRQPASSQAVCRGSTALQHSTALQLYSALQYTSSTIPLSQGRRLDVAGTSLAAAYPLPT